MYFDRRKWGKIGAIASTVKIVAKFISLHARDFFRPKQNEKVESEFFDIG